MRNATQLDTTAQRAKPAAKKDAQHPICSGLSELLLRNNCEQGCAASVRQWAASPFDAKHRTMRSIALRSNLCRADAACCNAKHSTTIAQARKALQAKRSDAPWRSQQDHWSHKSNKKAFRSHDNHRSHKRKSQSYAIICD